MGGATPATAAGWTTPVPVSDPTMYSSLAKAGVNDRGDAVSVWQNTGRSADGAKVVGTIWASVRPAGRNWTTPTAISPTLGTTVTQLELAVQTDGSAVAAWSGDNRATVAAISPAGAWNTPRTFGAIFGGIPLVLAANGKGDAVLAWYRSASADGTKRDIAQATRDGASGAWTEAASLASVRATGLAAAVGPNGDAAIGWTQSNTPAGAGVVVRRAGGPFGAPTTLGVPGRVVSAPTIAVDGTGSTTFVWASHEAAGSTADHLLASSRSAGNDAWSAPTLLDRLDAAASSPLVAVDGAGNAVAAWSQSDGAEPRVLVAGRGTGGGWSTPQPVTPTGPDVASVAPSQLRMNARGDAIVAYAKPAGTSRYFGSGFVRRLAGREWEAAYPLPNPVVNVASISAGLDAAGRATGVWLQGEAGATAVVFASDLDVPVTPTPAPTQAPTPATTPPSVDPSPSAGSPNPAPPSSAFVAPLAPVVPTRYAARLRVSGGSGHSSVALDLDLDLPRRGKSCPTVKALEVAVTARRSGKGKSSRSTTLMIRSRALRITSGAGICTVKGTLKLRSTPASATIRVKVSSAKTKSVKATALPSDPDEA